MTSKTFRLPALCLIALAVARASITDSSSMNYSIGGEGFDSGGSSHGTIRSTVSSLAPLLAGESSSTNYDHEAGGPVTAVDPLANLVVNGNSDFRAGTRQAVKTGSYKLFKSFVVTDTFKLRDMHYFRWPQCMEFKFWIKCFQLTE